MLYQQGEGRIVRGIGLGLSAVLSAYVSWVLYNQLIPVDQVGVYKPGLAAALVLLVVTLGGGFYGIYMNPGVSAFLIEVEVEARKIHWPSWPDVKGSTIQVITVMVFLMVFLFCVDFILTQVRGFLY